MAFCPNCEAEYKAGVGVCPDCDLDLVSERTAQNRVHDVGDMSFVVFRSCRNSVEAQMVLELLERQGIRAYAKAGDIGIFGTSFAGGVVMVDEKDLSRAQEIYEAYFDAGSNDASILEDEDQFDGQ